MECLFCSIAQKKIPVEIVREDDATVSFLDIQPRGPGHTLVIPKKHYGTILEVPQEEMEPLFSAVKKTAEMVLKGLKAEGLTIGINQGRVSGQAIDHLHIHVFARYTNDGGGSIHSVIHNPPKESLAQIAQKIRTVKQND